MARPKGNAITINDIANDAQVSVATVSRVLNNPGYKVSPEARKAVIDSAERLNYIKGTPRLRHSRIRNEIGVIVPNITNSMYYQALTGIEMIARDYGYGVFICNTLRDKEREYDYLCEMQRKHIRSVILSSVSTNIEGIHEFIERGMNIVMLDQRISGVDCAHVNFDMNAGACMAVDHLVDYGHKRIGLAIMPITRWSRTQIVNGFRDALNRSGLQFDESLIFTSRTESETYASGGDFAIGVEIGEKVIAKLDSLTALVVVNSMTCCGILSTFKDKGIRVPDQLSMVSLDDFAPAKVLNPAMTSLHLPVFEAGKIAATIVISRLAQQHPSLISMGVKPELMIRDSTRRI